MNKDSGVWKAIERMVSVCVLVVLFNSNLSYGYGAVEDLRVKRMTDYGKYMVELRTKEIELKKEAFMGADWVLGESSESIVEEVENPPEAIVESPERMIIGSVKEAREYEIWTRSNWKEEDFEGIIPKTLQGMVPVAIRMEEEIGVNAVYLLSVAANETGWGKHMAGRNNYYNWSNNGIKYFDFASVAEFEEFSIGAYMRGYSEPEHFKKSYGRVPDKITVEVVNTKYAIHLDGRTNWLWTDTVSQIMKGLSDKRLKKLGL